MIEKMKHKTDKRSAKAAKPNLNKSNSLHHLATLNLASDYIIFSSSFVDITCYQAYKNCLETVKKTNLRYMNNPISMAKSETDKFMDEFDPSKSNREKKKNKQRRQPEANKSNGEKRVFEM